VIHITIAISHPLYSFNPVVLPFSKPIGYRIIKIPASFSLPRSSVISLEIALSFYPYLLLSATCSSPYLKQPGPALGSETYPPTTILV
ncbi:MAG TPA: hypothetical protein PK233_00725, partial [Candidatus Atribacteria bacterium]|nr:hypothetical protein [Candidatus Atribacteria bacterium]